jgi:hypothetical protein
VEERVVQIWQQALASEERGWSEKLVLIMVEVAIHGSREKEDARGEECEDQQVARD